jgi:lipoprotein NlpI
MPDHTDTQDIMKRLDAVENALAKMAASVEHLVAEMHASRVNFTASSKDFDYLVRQVNHDHDEVNELKEHRATVDRFLAQNKGALGVLFALLAVFSGVAINGVYDMVRLEKRVSILEIQLQKQADNKVSALRRALDCNEKGCPKPPDADTEPKPLP